MECLAHTITNYTNSARNDGPMGFGGNPSPFFDHSSSTIGFIILAGAPSLIGSWHTKCGGGETCEDSEVLNRQEKERWLYPSHDSHHIFFSVFFSVFQIYPPT